MDDVDGIRPPSEDQQIEGPLVEDKRVPQTKKIFSPQMIISNINPPPENVPRENFLKFTILKVILFTELLSLSLEP